MQQIYNLIYVPVEVVKQDKPSHIKIIIEFMQIPFPA